jgi:hypothetical protein
MAVAKRTMTRPDACLPRAEETAFDVIATCHVGASLVLLSLSLPYKLDPNNTRTEY